MLQGAQDNNIEVFWEESSNLYMNTDLRPACAGLNRFPKLNLLLQEKGVKHAMIRDRAKGEPLQVGGWQALSANNIIYFWNALVD